MNLSKAEILTSHIIAQLSPGCKQCFVVGSVRRQKKFVSDIEIICEVDFTKISKVERISLFEEKNHYLFFDEVRTLGIPQNKIEDNSRYIKILLPEQIMLDIFIPDPDDFGRQVAIRTGNWVYSKDVIATGWRKAGWVGTKDGLRRLNECTKMGRSWVCNAVNPTLPPRFETEKQFFEFINVEYIEPKDREFVLQPTSNPEDGDDV